MVIGPDSSTLDALTRRQIALAALCDERTVTKFFAGGRLRPTAALRIRRALRRLRLDVKEGAATT